MKVKDWLLGKFIGRSHLSTLYNGMAENERRSRAKRAAYLTARRKQVEQDFVSLRVPMLVGRKATVEDAVAYYRCLILRELLWLPEHKLRHYSPATEAQVFNSIFSNIHPDCDLSDPSWKRTRKELRAEPLVTQLLPTFFSKRFAAAWAAVQPEKQKAYRAETERIRQSELARAAAYKEEVAAARAEENRKLEIRLKIHHLEENLRDLNSMFHASAGGDQMTRYRLITSIESTENALARLREMHG